MDWLIFQDPQRYQIKDPDAIIAKIEKVGITLRSMGDGVLWAADPQGILEEHGKKGPAMTLARTRMAGLRSCAQQISEYLEIKGKVHGSRIKP